MVLGLFGANAGPCIFNFVCCGSVGVEMSVKGEKKKAKGRAPAHQNKFAFYHNKNSTKTVAITNMVRGQVEAIGVRTGIISGAPGLTCLFGPVCIYVCVRVCGDYLSRSFFISACRAQPNIGLCQKCHDIIEWKKQYRKYKPRTVPGKWYKLSTGLVSFTLTRVNQCHVLHRVCMNHTCRDILCLA